LNVSGEEFRINEEFQQGALQLADHLNLDELDAARIFLEVQSETDSSGRSSLTNSIIRFHQRRKVLLDCLRLTLRLSADVDREGHIRASLQALIAQVVQSQNAPSRYIQRCLSSMGDIKSRLQDLVEKLNSASILGQSQQAELLQTIEFERGSLVKQHESLGIVLLYLVKENYSVLADFEWTIDHLRKADKYDNLLCEQTPFKLQTGPLSQ
jgi:nuclear pore complex protein Nup205